MQQWIKTGLKSRSDDKNKSLRHTVVLKDIKRKMKFEEHGIVAKAMRDTRQGGRLKMRPRLKIRQSLGM